MAIEALRGAGMTYMGSSSAAVIREQETVKAENASTVQKSEELETQTTSISTKQTDNENAKNEEKNENQQGCPMSQNSQIKLAVDEINKKAKNSEAVFGVHDATKRVTIKIVDKETKEVLKEYPPEKMLDMIAKVWENAGLMVDKKL